MKTEHPLVQLARRTIETYIREHSVIEPTHALGELGAKRAGAFVSLHRQHQLRGCIGTIESVYGDLEHEVIQNAISAATRDPRFPPVRANELADLEISVDVLGEPEPIEGLGELDPTLYGVIVEKGNRRGLLLPDLDGVDTPRQQVDIALSKAGIEPRETYRMYRFRVDRYH